MDQNNDQQKAIKLLQQGRVEAAGEILLELAKEDSEKKEKILHLLINYKNLKNDFNAGILSESKYILERNKILRGLTESSKNTPQIIVSKKTKFKTSSGDRWTNHNPYYHSFVALRL